VADGAVHDHSGAVTSLDQRAFERASDSLHDDGLEGFVDLDADGDAVVGPHPTAQLSFPVNRLSSGNRLEDRELQKGIDARWHPTIIGLLTAAVAVVDEGASLSGAT
jgi:hypothetical protein